VAAPIAFPTVGTFRFLLSHGSPLTRRAAVFFWMRAGCRGLAPGLNRCLWRGPGRDLAPPGAKSGYRRRRTSPWRRLRAERCACGARGLFPGRIARGRCSPLDRQADFLKARFHARHAVTWSKRFRVNAASSLAVMGRWEAGCDSVSQYRCARCCTMILEILDGKRKSCYVFIKSKRLVVIN
jgi:hypothetical protein